MNHYFIISMLVLNNISSTDNHAIQKYETQLQNKLSQRVKSYNKMRDDVMNIAENLQTAGIINPEEVKSFESLTCNGMKLFIYLDKHQDSYIKDIIIKIGIDEFINLSNCMIESTLKYIS